MQPPNLSDDQDDATVIGPKAGCSTIKEDDLSDATLLPTPRSEGDATVINPAVDTVSAISLTELGPLDTARLQNSPIRAHYKPPRSKLPQRIALGVILLLAWLLALWWYKHHHKPSVEPVQHSQLPALETPTAPITAVQPEPTEGVLAPTAPAPESVLPPTPAAPAATTTSKPAFQLSTRDMNKLFDSAKTAIQANQLEPATDSASATGLLIQMNMLDAKDERIIEIRKLLAEAHLKLSKEARSKSNWDAAEHHTDEAWKARDSNAYLNPP